MGFVSELQLILMRMHASVMWILPATHMPDATIRTLPCMICAKRKSPWTEAHESLSPWRQSHFSNNQNLEVCSHSKKKLKPNRSVSIKNIRKQLIQTFTENHRGHKIVKPRFPQAGLEPKCTCCCNLKANVKNTRGTGSHTRAANCLLRKSTRRNAECAVRLKNICFSKSQSTRHPATVSLRTWKISATPKLKLRASNFHLRQNLSPKLSPKATRSKRTKRSSTTTSAKTRK